MARSFRSMPRSRSVRRKTGWSSGPSTSSGTLSSAAAVLWTVGAASTEDAITLVRTRGSGLVALSVASGQGDGFNGAVGIGITDAKAFAVGLTAVPHPLTDAGDDGWLWHEFFHVRAPSAVASNAMIDADAWNVIAGVKRFEIDSKAMRKMGQGGSIVYGILEGSESGTAVIDFSFNTRLLAKLP